MLQKHIFQGINGNRKLWLIGLGMNKNPDVERRLSAIKFYDRHGINATIDAFQISKSSLYSWRSKYIKSKYDEYSLIPISKKPHKTPRKIIHIYYKEEILRLRLAYGYIGKQKVQILMKQFCIDNNLKIPSVSTVGRIIKNYNLVRKKVKEYHRYKYKVRVAPKTNKAGYVEIDSVAIFENGVKSYVFNAIDVASRFMYSFVYPVLNSLSGADFLAKLFKVYPHKLNTIQTDNGQEFKGYFHQYTKKKKVSHKYILPRSPKINGTVERANRTLKEEFIRQRRILFANEKYQQINLELAHYLIWYNNERPHLALKNCSPSNYIINKLNSNMSWTYTWY